MGIWMAQECEMSLWEQRSSCLDLFSRWCSLSIFCSGSLVQLAGLQCQRSSFFFFSGFVYRCLFATLELRLDPAERGWTQPLNTAPFPGRFLTRCVAHLLVLARKKKLSASKSAFDFCSRSFSGNRCALPVVAYRSE